MNTAINQLSDAELVMLFQEGNQNAFAELLQRHKSKVFTTILVIVRDRYVAEDLFQDTFIKALRLLRESKYCEDGKFLPWIVRVAKNMAIDHIRKSKRQPLIVMDSGSPFFSSFHFADSNAESVQIELDESATVRKLISQLSEEQRDVLIMRHFADMSFKEIADATGVSINTALGRMRYALLNLRKLLDKHQNAYEKKLYSSGNESSCLQQKSSHT
ncbi:MAG TPA: RNA polymerase subunit sigma-24 [Cytophagales bacterium]|nr:RNA polymerase subunit sigma-24 [Cytophagales bacterium]